MRNTEAHSRPERIYTVQATFKEIKPTVSKPCMTLWLCTAVNSESVSRESDLRKSHDNEIANQR